MLPFRGVAGRIPRRSIRICRFPSRRHFTTGDLHHFVSQMTETLQAVHTFTGLPWWALIPLTTVTLRSVWTLPLAILQRKRVQKQSELRPLVSAMNPVLKLNLAKKVQAAKRRAQKSLEASSSNKSSNESNSISTESFAVLQSPLASMKYEEVLVLSTKETRKRQRALFKKNNVQLWKNMLLPAFQVPLWVSMSLAMRDLSGWTSWDSLANKPLDETLYSEGLFWFTDLTSFDQLHVFPLLVGVTALCNVEWTFKTLELSRLTMKRRLRPTLTDAISNLSRMTVVFMMAISLNAPSALTLYWLSSQVYSLLQNVILDLTLPISFTPRKRFNYKESKSADARPVIKTHS